MSEPLKKGDFKELEQAMESHPYEDLSDAKKDLCAQLLILQMAINSKLHEARAAGLQIVFAGRVALVQPPNANDKVYCDHYEVHLDPKGVTNVPRDGI